MSSRVHVRKISDHSFTSHFIYFIVAILDDPMSCRECALFSFLIFVHLHRHACYFFSAPSDQARKTREAKKDRKKKWRRTVSVDEGSIGAHLGHEECWDWDLDSSCNFLSSLSIVLLSKKKKKVETVGRFTAGKSEIFSGEMETITPLSSCCANLIISERKKKKKKKEKEKKRYWRR